MCTLHTTVEGLSLESSFVFLDSQMSYMFVALLLHNLVV